MGAEMGVQNMCMEMAAEMGGKKKVNNIKFYIENNRNTFATPTVGGKMKAEFA